MDVVPRSEVLGGMQTFSEIGSGFPNRSGACCGGAMTPTCDKSPIRKPRLARVIGTFEEVVLSIFLVLCGTLEPCANAHYLAQGLSELLCKTAIQQI